MASGKAEGEKEKSEVGGRKAEVEPHPPEGVVAEQVPEYLVYEWVKGKPLYYKGYKDVLAHLKSAEEVMSESMLQAFLKNYLGRWIEEMTKGRFVAMAGEIGLQLGMRHSRGADVVIYPKGSADLLSPKYTQIPPAAILEIDIKADLDQGPAMAYIAEKIDDYHQFGVERVLWILTQPKKIILALPNRPWLIYNWTDEVEIIDGLSIQVEDWIEEEAKRRGYTEE